MWIEQRWICRYSAALTLSIISPRRPLSLSRSRVVTTILVGQVGSSEPKLEGSNEQALGSLLWPGVNDAIEDGIARI